MNDRRHVPYRAGVRMSSWIVLIPLALLFSFANAAATDRLVLISPHWEGIKYEFDRAFRAYYQKETGRAVELEWMDVGGTSEVVRFIRSEFKNKPAGVGIDLFFGGGLEPYLALKAAKLLQPYRLPEPLMREIPPDLGGVPLYDPDYMWYGPTLSGFGIVYNKVVLKLVKLPVIETWEDLASPAAFGWVGSSDPRKSGSVHLAYEIILQAYGWDKGWRIITAMGGNVRSFTGSASQVPKDVAIGEVAYGLSIDFYAWAQVDEAGADKIGFVMPPNLTIINPDCIGILKGAPNQPVAEAFLRFAMSEAGQKLWMWRVGSTGGPQKYQLNRFSVLPQLYDFSTQDTAVQLNPFSWQSGFVYDAKLGAARWAIVNDLIGALVIDQKDALTRAWEAALERGLTEQEWQRLAAMPVTEAEALELAKTKWQDAAFRNQKVLEWTQFARAKYHSGIKQPIIRPEWFSLYGFITLAFGLFIYSLRRKR